MITLLNKKRIILGVTGSIAAYKTADLASKLTQAGAEVDVILTEGAQAFITPLTFEALTGRPVYSDIWGGAAGASGLPAHIAHIGLAEKADFILIAPATANSIAKMAHGLADDLLSVTVLAARCPIAIAPAMDGGMYENPATLANVDILRQRGILVIEPEYGRFASGLEGRGRLPDTETLLGQVRRILGRQGALKNRHIVVTAGGTREAIDPVRYITNASSGKQGYAIAQAALDAGAQVTLISTVKDLPAPIGATLILVTSAEEMRDAVLLHADCDAIIMAAAVADFRPATQAKHKIKKDTAPDTIQLERNDDILALVGKRRQEGGLPSVLVGFAAETENLVENAQSKLERKNADMIVANDLTTPGAGFASDNNAVTFITRNNPPQGMGLTTKPLVAEEIIWRVGAWLKNNKYSQG